MEAPSPRHTPRIDAVIAYWFAARTDTSPLDLTSFDAKRWFGQDEATGADLRARFESDHEAAAKGALADWEASSHGSLALSLLLDSFPRLMYPDTERAYGGDALAQQVVLRALAAGYDGRLGLLERLFLYMPLMHSEDLALHKKALRLYEGLVKLSREQTPQNAPFFVFAYGLERKHYVIVERFGRYPHRNKALGRTPTAEEEAFLAGPSSSF